MEAGVEIGGPFESDDRTILCTTTPAGRAARAVHRGPYNEMSAAHSAVLEFCRQRGYQLAGPSWEMYGDWHEDPSQLETEVYYLLSLSSSGGGCVVRSSSQPIQAASA